MRTSKFPARTAQRMAACKALGFDYWADSPINSTVWAADAESGRFHLVHLDLKRGIATHECGVERWHRSGMMLTQCAGQRTAVPFPDLAACAEVSGLTVTDLAGATSVSAAEAVDLFSHAMSMKAILERDLVSA